MSYGKCAELFVARTSREKTTTSLVLAYCGLRWRKAIGLRVTDLDLLSKRVTVVENALNVNMTMLVRTPKSDKSHVLPIPGFFVAEVARQSEGKDERTWFSRVVTVTIENVW